MDGCLVPFLPAVMVAVERLEELEQRLSAQRAPFAPEAGVHLTGAAAAVSRLEAERRAARERLEAESIDNSTLRGRVRGLRERMREEVRADVAAARDASRKEMEKLSSDLRASRRLREDAANRLQDLLDQNKALYADRERVKGQREAIVAALNDHIVQKSSLERQLEQTRELIEELKPPAAAARQEVATLEEAMALERRASSQQRDDLSREADRIQEEIRAQKETEETRRRELAEVNGRKEESLGRLREGKSRIAEVECDTQRLRASWRDRRLQLGEETAKHRELLQQIEALKETPEAGKHSGPAVRSLRDQLSSMDGKMEQGWASRQLSQDALPQVCEELQHQRDEEDESRAELGRLAQQLERRLALQQQLPLQIEVHMASMVRHRKEMRAMEETMDRLLEEDLINRRVFKSDADELRGRVDAEKRNLGRAEDEVKPVAQLLEAAQTTQREHEVQLRSDISNARRRHETALQEQAELQQRMLRQKMPKCWDVDALTSHVAQSEKDSRRKESALRRKLHKCIAETERISESTAEKQREAGEKEEMIKEVEERCDEERSRAERLRALTSEQSTRLAELQLSSHALKEQTGLLLHPKEELKAQLEELRRRYLDLLGRQRSELRAVEVSVYRDGANLQQVGVENSRLQLCTGRMTDDIRAIGLQADRDGREIRLLGGKIKVLFECLQEAFRGVR